MEYSYWQELVCKLNTEHNLTDQEFLQLIKASFASPVNELLASAADKLRREYYGNAVFIRGLIEFTNYCKNNCYYCGIRAGNNQAQRFRLTPEAILSCCRKGYELGFHTFVLQGGEDPYYTDDKICDLVSSIHQEFPECAITLSIGEKTRESYAAYKAAGVQRYLLRHESASEAHYSLLHPASLSLTNRKNCLWTLKELGYQVGAGFMVGSPYQTAEHLVEDLRFLQQLQPDMIGIGPFIHHPDTPFGNQPDGTLELSLRMLSILRLCFPYALIPSTTALGTIAPNGRELGLQSGGNVVMPNLSPEKAKQLYQLYNNKLHTGAEAAQGLDLLKQKVEAIGYEIITARGDVNFLAKEKYNESRKF